MTTGAQRPIKNILLDINGVLFESGESQPIAGSVEAMKRLVEAGLNFCLVTNECTTAKRLLAQKLNNFGYHQVRPSMILSPAPVACSYLLEQKLRPRLHVSEGILEDFEPVLGQNGCSKPNCLVVGDLMDKISRDFMDESLELMLNSEEPIQIVGLGAGRYYKDAGRLRMDTGAYIKAFEYSLGVGAISFGKPSRAFFEEALAAVRGSAEDTIMIGDDILTDVGGAQAHGLRGFLVRTGKYKKSDETCDVKADGVFENLHEAVEAIISSPR